MLNKIIFNRSLQFKIPIAINTINALQNKVIRNFATQGSKSIYSKKKKYGAGNSEFNDGNTIDITDSQKEFNANINLELKNLEKSTKKGTFEEFKINETNKLKKDVYKFDSKNKTSEDHEDMQQEIKNMKEFDYDMFKQRNKEISLKEKKVKQEKEVKEQEEEEDKQKESVIDEKTLLKLQQLIQQDKEINGGKESYKKVNDEGESKINIEDFDEKTVLVHRPLKNFVWGLGQQTKQKKFKFVSGEYPSVEALVSFLEVNSIKDIIVVPTHKLGMVHLKENTILCSGHTSRHIYKTAKDLVVDLKKLNIPNLPFIPTVFGRRDEEWLIVEIGEVQVHLFVESFRKEMDLLERWLNPAPEDYIEWQRRVDNEFYERR